MGMSRRRQLTRWPWRIDSASCALTLDEDAPRGRAHQGDRRRRRRQQRRQPDDASRLDGVEFIVANTDLQALASQRRADQAPDRRKLTKGLGAGADPDVGRKAALEDTDKLDSGARRAPTWSSSPPVSAAAPAPGAAPVIASLARELGALTIAVVTKPFKFEGKKRQMQAEPGSRRCATASTRSSRSPTSGCSRSSSGTRRSTRPSRSPTTCCARRSRASRT